MTYRIWEPPYGFVYFSEHPNETANPPFDESMIELDTRVHDVFGKRIFMGDIVKSGVIEGTVIMDKGEFYFASLMLNQTSILEWVGNKHEFFEVRKNNEDKPYDGEFQCGFPAKFNSLTYAKMCRERLRGLDYSSNWSIYYRGVKYA